MAKATWNRILDDLTRLQVQQQRKPSQPGQPTEVDKYRRARIGAVEKFTGRPLIIYASSFKSFKSHARAVKIPDLVSLGAKVIDVRSDPNVYAAVDELYCCLDILLGNSPVYKIFENSSGDALVRQAGMIQAQIVQQGKP